MFFSAATESGHEAEIVSQLNLRPPDMVILISRDLIGFRIQRYGERVGRAALLLRWVDESYARFAELGGDPLDYRERGAIIFKRR
jgi:hypothetical protein